MAATICHGLNKFWLEKLYPGNALGFSDGDRCLCFYRWVTSSHVHLLDLIVIGDGGGSESVVSRLSARLPVARVPERISRPSLSLHQSAYYRYWRISFSTSFAVSTTAWSPCGLNYSGTSIINISWRKRRRSFWEHTAPIEDSRLSLGRLLRKGIAGFSRALRLLPWDDSREKVG